MDSCRWAIPCRAVPRWEKSVTVAVAYREISGWMGTRSPAPHFRPIRPPGWNWLCEVVGSDENGAPVNGYGKCNGKKIRRKCQVAPGER
jgi:hypothetical protein